jgi:hypothetical protein
LEFAREDKKSSANQLIRQLRTKTEIAKIYNSYFRLSLIELLINQKLAKQEHFHTSGIMYTAKK